MRTVLLSVLAAAAAGLIAAGCGGGSSSASASGSSSSSGSSAGASGLDKEYLMTSIEGDRFEIQGGRLALAKSHNPAVRRLARRLIKDHTQSLSDAAKLASQVGGETPSSPSPSEQWELKVVKSMSAAAFNRWYASLEVYDHHQDIQEASDEVSMGSDPAVRKDARTEIPTLRTHLRLSEQALKAS